MAPTVDQLRAAHRRSMEAWGLPVGGEYEREVIERALTSPPPVALGHTDSFGCESNEVGSCVDCDAAYALEWADEAPLPF